ncbi:MAG: hypothetical protein Q7J54_02535 [Candidatus Woesearchaeota archaeon]|nr:hypothetical protein [Candidatus Woesearchaeota archaeon]
MSELVDLRDKISRYFKFSAEETKALMISILVVAFIVSFDKWGTGTEFQLMTGVKNFFISILLVALIVLINQVGHRIVGLIFGYKVEYKMWWYGLLIGLLLIVMSASMKRGFPAFPYIWFLAPGGIFIHMLPQHRLGKFRYGPNTNLFSHTSLAGPIAGILFGTILKSIDLWFHLNSAAIQQIFLIGLIYGAYQLLPIPPLAGSRIFFASRLIYVFVATSIIAYAILFAWLNVYSFIFALLIGAVCWLIFYVTFERKTF